MGTCCSRCYSEIRHRSQSVRFSYFSDSNTLVEFDSLMEEQPRKTPASLVTSHERKLVNNNQLQQLVVEKEKQDGEILVQFAREEEELELQEESALDARMEALRIRKFANDSEIINPARLAFDNNALWLGDDASNWNVAGQEYSSTILGECGSKQHGSPAVCYKRERLLTGASTPLSSVDLEWENEDGLSPPTHAQCDTDDVSDTASCLSQLSTPMSNGNEELEWDGHFTSTHISQLDMETERLISEIELLTTDALNEGEADR